MIFSIEQATFPNSWKQPLYKLHLYIVSVIWMVCKSGSKIGMVVIIIIE